SASAAGGFQHLCKCARKAAISSRESLALVSAGASNPSSGFASPRDSGNSRTGATVALNTSRFGGGSGCAGEARGGSRAVPDGCGCGEAEAVVMRWESGARSCAGCDSRSGAVAGRAGALSGAGSAASCWAIAVAGTMSTVIASTGIGANSLGLANSTKPHTSSATWPAIEKTRPVRMENPRPATPGPLLARPRRRAKRPDRSRFQAEITLAFRRALAEEHAALGLVGLRRFQDLHHHRLGIDLEVPHHRLGDVLDQGPLLVERASLDGMDVDFRHGFPPCSARPCATVLLHSQSSSGGQSRCALRTRRGLARHRSL